MSTMPDGQFDPKIDAPAWRKFTDQQRLELRAQADRIIAMTGQPDRNDGDAALPERVYKARYQAAWTIRCADGSIHSYEWTRDDALGMVDHFASWVENECGPHAVRKPEWPLWMQRVHYVARFLSSAGIARLDPSFVWPERWRDD